MFLPHCTDYKESKQCNTISHVQSTSILLADKCAEYNNSIPDDNFLVNAKYRGDLCKVKSEALEIFLSVELLFRSVSEASDRPIESKAMVSQLVQDCGILSNFNKILSLRTMIKKSCHSMEQEH